MRRLRSQRGQSTIEYVGVIVVVAALIVAIAGSGVGGDVRAALAGAVCEVTGGSDCGGGAEGGQRDTLAAEDAPPADPSADSDGDGVPDGEDPAPRERDADGDGLSDGEELALGSDAHRADSDGDGLSDREEFEQGTDPTQAVAPLTEENAFEPWERLGISEDEWRELEAAILDEVNPGGVEGALFGASYAGVTLDEEGRIQLIEIQQMGIGGGLFRGIARGLGLAKAPPSLGQAISNVGSRLRPDLVRRLAARGVPGLRSVRPPRVPAPPVRPGTAFNALDDLGRPTGASATITRETLGTGTPASRSIRPPGFEGGAAGHARGHLIGRQLGGSGDDARNLVTLHQTPANSPVMRGFENQVRAAVEAGETVRYTAQPIYRGSELVPRAVTLSARGSRGFRLDVTVLNKGP